MIKFLNKKLTNGNNRKVFSNFLSLSVLQGANYALPFVTFPYLVRVLEAQNFGKIAFAQAIVSYFILLVDYGYNLSFTKQITNKKENNYELSLAFSSIFILKLIFIVVGFLLLLILLYSVPKLRAESLLIILSYGAIVGHALIPSWFFQGIEQMKFITIVNVISKVVATVSIFLVINYEDDYILVPVLNTLGYLAGAIISLMLIYFRSKIKLFLPKVKNFKLILKDGVDLFISSLFITSYTSFNIILLGLLTGEEDVGYFVISEKITIACISLFGIPLNQAVYPFLANIYLKSKTEFYIKATKLLKLLSIGLVLVSILVLFSSSLLVKLVAGNELQESINVLKILSFTIVMSPLCGFLTQYLVIIGKSRISLKIVAFAAVINILLAYFLISNYGIIGLGFNNVIIQVLLTLAYLLVTFLIKKKHFQIA